MDEAERLRLCTEEDLGEIVRVHRGRAGAGVLADLLRRALRRDRPQHATTSRSAFLALCRKHHLPQPQVNVPLLDYVVDFFWAEASLIAEVDGRGSHSTRRAFQDDRDRDGRLAVAGYTVVRFTWFDVTRRPPSSRIAFAGSSRDQLSGRGAFSTAYAE